jgi:hypothetical protein
MPMPMRSFRLATIMLLAVQALCGCGSGSYRVAPLDADEARETLQSALESWKKDESIDALQKETPPIVVVDVDWSGGMKLLTFEAIDQGTEVDGRLVNKVKLTLQDARGAQRKETVTYLVTTSPALTVLRDIRQ